MGKQQEMAEASYQLRSRILEWNARSFSAIPVELIPIEDSCVSALSQQQMPDYFGGPAMAKKSLKSRTWILVPSRKTGRQQFW